MDNTRISMGLYYNNGICSFSATINRSLNISSFIDSTCPNISCLTSKIVKQKKYDVITTIILQYHARIANISFEDIDFIQN